MMHSYNLWECLMETVIMEVLILVVMDDALVQQNLDYALLSAL